MKRVLALLVGVFFLFAHPVCAAEGLVKVSENVYSYVFSGIDATPANSYGANAGIVIGKDGVLVVDTLMSAKEARRLIADIKKVTDKPIKYVVNTHYHFDHAFGNAEFVKLGATVVSQVNDQASLKQITPEMIGDFKSMGLTEDDIKELTIAPATITYTDRMNIDLGGETVELIYPGPAHSSGCTLVFMPQEKVLFAGDVLFTDFHPYMAEGDIAGWEKALDVVKNLGAEKIIPGHGPLSGEKDVADMKAYLQVFDEKAKELAATSSDATVIAAELKKSLPQRSQLEWAITANLTKYLSKPAEAVPAGK